MCNNYIFEILTCSLKTLILLSPGFKRAQIQSPKSVTITTRLSRGLKHSCEGTREKQCKFVTITNRLSRGLKQLIRKTKIKIDKIMDKIQALIGLRLLPSTKNCTRHNTNSKKLCNMQEKTTNIKAVST